MSIAEHSDRASHHRQPRRVSTHWAIDLTRLHHGADPATCEECRACPTCGGQGEVSPNPHAASTPALILTECPDCGGSGERGGASHVHADPYCVTHCRPGIKHSQCGCPCDHREVTA